LILRFYEGEGREKIDNRKRLAQEMSLSRNALGIRLTIYASSSNVV
jgi:hypothetical protein